MVIRLNKISITPGFILLAAAVCFFDTWITFPALILSVFLHEFGHIAFLRAFGARIEKISLECVGFNADYDGSRLSYPEETAAALAGPAVSLAAAVIFAVLGRTAASDCAYYVSGINMVLFLFNMLPIWPLDGGRAIYMAVSSMSSVYKADRVRAVLDKLTAVVMLAVGILLLVKSGGNFTLLLIAICVVKKNKMV